MVAANRDGEVGANEEDTEADDLGEGALVEREGDLIVLLERHLRGTAQCVCVRECVCTCVCLCGK